MQRRQHQRDQESLRSVTHETPNHCMFIGETIDLRVEAPTLELHKAPVATSMQSTLKREMMEMAQNHLLQIGKRKELHVGSCCVASHVGTSTSPCRQAPFVADRRVQLLIGVKQ
ncbi:Hypothetical predicted protein [Olea europaea subsp. europaea]|uniref:Uncharacterized protein n=1 Tax=Olea europaea subsp. europaea TaxID=158383 RepID=A0A8S0P852_OLEEU|nr:Hypothetical predicted protein [Olea europaea subsp. europaea]